MITHYIEKLDNGGVMMGLLAKIGNGITNRLSSFVSYFRDGFRELKKVRWPNRKELTSYSIIVISTVVFVTIYFVIVDLGISSLLQLIGLGK